MLNKSGNNRTGNNAECNFASRNSNDHGSLLSLTQISLIGVALQTPLKALLRARITYLQRIQKTKTMQPLIILGSMVFPISAALILKKFFGIYGLLFCYTAGDFLSLTAVWLYHVFTTKKLFPRANDYLSLPDSFHIKPEDIISLDIRNMDDISVTDVKSRKLAYTKLRR